MSSTLIFTANAGRELLSGTIMAAARRLKGCEPHLSNVCAPGVHPTMISRRKILAGSALASVALLVRPAFATTGVSSGLMARGLAALDKHRSEIPQRDLLALADLSKPSSDRR